MKDLAIGRNRIIPLAGFACLALVIGPALTSLGVDGAVESTVGSTSVTAKDNQVVYRAIFNRKGKQGDSASGTIQLADGIQNEIEAGNVVLTLKPVKDGHNWNITVQGYDNVTRRIIWNSKLIMHDIGGASIESKLDAQADNDVSGISFSLSPLAEARRNIPKVSLVEEPDGRVYLNFKQPTEIRDLIKTVAQLTGKNVVLDRDVHGKMTLDDPRPVTKKEAYQAFVQALHLLDLDVIETGRVIKIVNKTKAG